MNFGNLLAGATSGTIILSTDGLRTASGGVSLPAVSGTVSSAKFVVNATHKFRLISIPTSITLTRVGGGGTMTVNTFTSVPALNANNNSGIQEIRLGARLNVPANQASGQYVSGNFTVTVNFF